MTATPPSFDLADGRWLPHRYLEGSDEVLFRYFDRDDHRRVTFLSPEEVGEGPQTVVPRAECMARLANAEIAPPRLIIHSAFCCSTMLTQAFDQPGVSMGLSEPMILNDVAGLALRRADSRQIAAALDVSLRLLGRPLDESEAVVVKPSCLFNPLLPLVLALRPGAKVLLLYAPVDDFVASVARKEIEGRLWVRELGWKLIRLGLAARFGLSEEELFRLTDLQLAGLTWLAQHALFHHLAVRHPANLRSLNSDLLLSRTDEVVHALAAHFDLPGLGDALASAGAFQRHSKDGRAFDAADRAAERERGIALHRRELDIVALWCRRLADHAAIPLELLAPLSA